MKITPLDIRRKEFKRSVRGYSDEEVDIFLDEVADEFERLFQENMELHDRMSRMDEQIAGHAQLKDALEKTLISAQLQAEELRANAHKETELILRDAEMKARGIVSDSYGETQKTQQTLVQLKLLEEDFRFKFRSLLEGYLRLLSEAPLASAGSEAASSPAATAVPASEAARPPSAAPAQPTATVASQAAPAAAPRPWAPPMEQIPSQGLPPVPPVPPRPQAEAGSQPAGSALAPTAAGSDAAVAPRATAPPQPAPRVESSAVQPPSTAQMAPPPVFKPAPPAETDGQKAMAALQAERQSGSRV